jgi:pyruvate formate lyase activating enzyme
MLISGFIKNSFIDYPGKIASVIFTQGCNMRCKYCHNYDLIPIKGSCSTYSEDEVLYYLKKARGFIDALVITGGEPTLQTNLECFIRKVKQLGILVKLDTNGTNPKILKKLLNEQLVDYVAMDIKNKIDLSAYQELVGKQFSQHQLNNVQESIEILKEADIEVEFRTTIIREKHSLNEIVNICKHLNTDCLYSIQSFVSAKVYDESFRNLKAYEKKEMQTIMESCKKYTPNFRML